MIDIGYEFNDPSLLVRALTHKSATKTTHNEKLEFIGDSVLDLYVASKLIALMPEAGEGALALRREKLVCEVVLANKARRAGIDKALVVGRSVAEPSQRMLADAFEAVLGAAYIDGGLQALAKIDRRLELVR